MRRPLFSVAPGRLLRDESGLTTTGMVLALLLTLSLVFSSAQVYRIQSVSSRVQSVADAASLAAGNVVAEFMIAVRLCDAVALSLSLTSLTATGLGVVALCVPGAQAAGGKLIESGQKVGQARDKFSRTASEGLTRVQKALPFLSAVAAASVASANNSETSRYVAMAVLVPDSAPDIGVAAEDAAAAKARDAAASQAEDIKRLANEADAASREANEAKRQAFERDCGNRPGYCMQERAETLAGMKGSSNPVYSSVDAWSFSVALRRAQTYYPARLASEAPDGQGVEARARSELRKRFFAYASEELSRGYVVEKPEFRAYFPHLPKNTDEMRETTLYTDAVYPCTTEDGLPMLHAWSGCPRAAGFSSTASIAAMEGGGWKTCSECGFAPESMGKVAAASSSIDNGFEYHYEAVAHAADAFQEAMQRAEPAKQAVKARVADVLAALKEACSRVGDYRITARPPGSEGLVVLCANVGTDAPAKGFESTFVQATGQVGTRVAVSASTLVADPSGEGGNVISSLTDGLAQRGAPAGLAGVALDCWAGLLSAYANGQSSLTNVVREGLDGLPLIGASGLGDWAADELSGAVEAVGLQPANLDALRPAVVNAAHVAGSDKADLFCARLVELKRQAVAHPLMSNGVFSSLAASVRRDAFAGIDAADGSVEVASIDVGGESVPIEISLPPAAREFAKGALGEAIDQLVSLYANETGVRPWD